MKYLLYLNKYLYKYRWKLIPGIFFVAASNYFGILPAKVIRIAFDLIKENISLYQLFNGFNRQEEIFRIFGYSVLLFGLLVLILALIRGVFLFLMRQTIILTSRHIEYDLKNEIYAHYQKLDMAFYRLNNTGDLMSRATEDVGRVRGYLGPAIMYSINTIVLTIMVVIAMINVSPILTFYALLPIPFLAGVILFINKIINKRSEKIQQQLSTLSNFVQETFSGIRVIKNYTREDKKIKDFLTEGNKYKDTSISLVKAQAIFFPLILLLVGLSTVLTVYIGGQEVIKGNISSGNIAEFIVYVNQLMFPAMSLAWVNSLIQRAAASQKRINEFLETRPAINNQNGIITKICGNIVFNDVSFTYPNTGVEALRNVSFKVNSGETLAILGRTGAGKSTIAALLMRMYDVESGEILIDEKPVKDYNLRNYRSQIGYVPQDVFLFSDTIERNIAFGQETVDRDKVMATSKAAAVYKNIIDFERGFQTEIGERGLTLSGGQKQRISIARALMQDPEVLIFDDSLSAVDTKTEEEILKNLSDIMRRRTSIIISHRVSTIKNADKIIVLEAGRIVEEGNHQALLNLKGYYFELFEKQKLDERVQTHG